MLPKIHCRDEEDSRCADHCRKFALSDPVDEDFKQQCLHDHLSKCDSCEELKTVLQSVEEKINELSSSMYSKEQHDNLLYDFGKSLNFINEWKCLILRCENQEIAKQSFIQNLTDDSVFIVINWAMKFLQRLIGDWYAKRGMNWHVSCAMTSDGKGNFFRFLLKPPIQQLFTGLVLCPVHLGESPNHRSQLKSKGKEGLSKIR